MGRKRKNEETPKKGVEPEMENPSGDAEGDSPSEGDSDETASGDAPQAGEEPEEDEVEFSANAVVAGSNSYLRSMMDTNFIEYASYVIKERAIPDVDDGLKPVQRRILWSMHRMDDGKFHKVANIIGHTMQFHPHGDASIGDALVVLANKEYYVDKQGNFGNIFTGDSASAPRYIEARLSNMAREVLFNRDITEFIPSYDGRNEEPVRLPAKIPSLLMLGSDGIAVGMSTHILPHNFKELLEAQIAILKGEDFEIYPDFPQGGTMDVSKYEDGNGKVVVRAKIDLDGRRLLIHEIPANTTTESLIADIERAANRSKIKIVSINDYTAEGVEIEIVPQRGYDPEKAIQALYAYTACQSSISVDMMVICENKPVQMSVSQVLRRNTDRLVDLLRAELEIEIGKMLDKLMGRTLAQIFVEEGVYKRIEKCKTYELILKEVRAGLEKFRSEWQPILDMLKESIARRGVPDAEAELKAKASQIEKGELPDSEIERLLEIPIRRISLFDIQKNKEEMELLRQSLDEANKNLKRIKAYAIRYLKGLLDKYGDQFPRRTTIMRGGFTKIDKSEVALNNIKVYWDRKGCYIGTSVKSDEYVVCNEFDHLLCVERKGEYKVIGIPDKVFIDRLYEFRKYDKTTEFGVVYSESATGKCYYKRCSIASFIKDKEYRICPEGCRLELITPRPRALYECQIDTPIKARKIQIIDLSEAPLRSPKASGLKFSDRKLLKITFVKYLDEAEVEGGSSDEGRGGDSGEGESSSETHEPSRAPSRVRPGDVAPMPDVQPPLIETPEPSEEEKPAKVKRGQKVKKDAPITKPDDENWGIEQPSLGF